MRRVLNLLYLIIFSMLLAALPGCITFTPNRYVDNQPLANPVNVDSVESGIVQLVDGRVYRVIELSDHGARPTDPNVWKDLLKQELLNVEVAEDPETYTSSLYVAREVPIVHCTIVPMMTVPLFPRDVDRYQRVRIGTVERVEKSGS